MAARRVLIAILAFIGGISIVAALIPVTPQTDGQDETTTSTSTTDSEDRQAAAPRPESDGQFVRETVRPSAGEEPRRIDLEAGDQLELLVYASAGTQVEVTRTGETDFADPLAPARFDLRLSETGIYLVKPLEGGEPLATIRVSEPKRDAPDSQDRPDGAETPSQSVRDVVGPELEAS
ncbi:hypothetical protein HJD18_08745 [Thermoleophilia bacterium SCSIO 60948]|nr:hypothetical protein HJD18_08745 [Thermoleophilia bacterium SCSIO 60948]